MSLREFIATGLLGMAVLLYPCTARADWRTDLGAAQLSGEGDFRFWGFRLYTAQLWVARLPFDASRPFALHLTYHRHIPRERLVSSGMDEMQRILGEGWREDVGAQWKAAMERAFADVNEGDSITGVCLPGTGARFYRNGVLTADVADPAFAQAFFSIWLGPHTRAPQLRAELINHRTEN